MWFQTALVFSFVATTTACNVTGPCKNSPAIAIPSTDGSHSAWVFVRDCGATTAKSTQVSILEADDDQPVRAGNAFIISGEAQVIATWRLPDRVDISFEESGEVIKQESEVAGIEITYNAE